MTRDEVLEAVIAAVGQVQAQSQRDLPPLHGDTRLIGDVPGCDSLVAIEVSIILTDILAPVLRGREIPDCILQGAGKGVRPTLGEIAAGVGSFIDASGSSASSKGKRGQHERPVMTSSSSSGESKGDDSIGPSTPSYSRVASQPSSSSSASAQLNGHQSASESGGNGHHE